MNYLKSIKRQLNNKTMNEIIKNAISIYCERLKITIPEDEKEYASLVEEILRDARPLYSEIGASHRWYDEKFVVVDISGTLIGYDWFHITGDNSASDMGLEFDIKSVCRVEKREKTVSYYAKL